MRIIFSRKGFDSSVGGHPSPILPDGTLLSLPIPSRLDSVRYEDLRSPCGRTIARVLEDLGSPRRRPRHGAHLDPDLQRTACARSRGWQPCFGQVGAAGGHLRNQGVGVGDVFLFYGWFRRTREHRGRLRFVTDAPDVHLIFGYLQVGRILYANELTGIPKGLRCHPHAHPQRLRQANNTLYLASRNLSLHPDLPGHGVFHERDTLQLTCPGLSRSRWRLDPDVFRHLPISYHSPAAWKEGYFQSYARGQEYVVPADQGVREWTAGLFKPD